MRVRKASFLEDVRQKFRVPALAGACVLGEELAFAEVTGTLRVNTDEPVSIDDAFHLGSCTKAMTATMLAKLVELGQLSWNTEVREAFPNLIHRLHPDFRLVTLLQLLSHRSGLPGGTFPERAIFLRLRTLKGSLLEQRQAFVELVLSRPPAYKPNTRMVYSNYGYVVAAAMAEAMTGKTWEELMSSLLFEPLEMRTAGFGTPARVWGHRHFLKKCHPVAPGLKADNPPVLAPAGSVHCSIKDWAKFAMLHLHGAQGKSGFLSRESFARLHTDEFHQGYSLGWLVTKRRWARGLALTHAGSNTLWFAVIWIAPERGIGLLSAANCGGTHAFHACDAAIAEMIQRFGR